MELSVHKDKIFTSFNQWKSQDAMRASAAGETRQEIGQFLELTGLNKKAVSIARALDKMEPEKRDDVLRSLDALRPLMDEKWGSVQTPDMFDAKEPEASSAPVPFKKKQMAAAE